MTLQIELTPGEEAWLRQRAAELGQPPEELAHEILRAQMPSGSNGAAAEQPLLPVVDEQGVFHQDRWDAVMASIARTSANAPVLPRESMTREAMYQDHD